MECNYYLVGGPLGHSAKEYINYEERNIHIWASTTTEVGFVLIGGVYSSGDLLYGDIYDMLLRFLVVPPQYPPDARISNIALMALPGCPVPINNLTNRPRTNFSGPDALARYTTRYEDEVKRIQRRMGLPRDDRDALARAPDNSSIPVGHFVCLIKFRWSDSISGQIHETLLENPPALVVNLIVNRKGPGHSTVPGTGNKSATRSDTTRKDVRQRDSICRVTGTPVLPRMRGTNYTGFEVAHIFPLAWAVRDYAPKFHPLVQPYLTNPKLADKPSNAFLLRADVHSQFDDYQFSAKQVSRQPPQWWLMRFERNGASSLPNRDQADPTRRLRRLLGPVTGSNVPDFDPVLMDHHFTIAVNWHVRGFGRAQEY